MKRKLISPKYYDSVTWTVLMYFPCPFLIFPVSFLCLGECGKCKSSQKKVSISKYCRRDFGKFVNCLFVFQNISSHYSVNHQEYLKRIVIQPIVCIVQFFSVLHITHNEKVPQSQIPIFLVTGQQSIHSGSCTSSNTRDPYEFTEKVVLPF